MFRNTAFLCTDFVAPTYMCSLSSFLPVVPNLPSVLIIIILNYALPSKVPPPWTSSSTMTKLAQYKEISPWMPILTSKIRWQSPLPRKSHAASTVISSIEAFFSLHNLQQNMSEHNNFDSIRWLHLKNVYQVLQSLTCLILSISFWQWKHNNASQ